MLLGQTILMGSFLPLPCTLGVPCGPVAGPVRVGKLGCAASARALASFQGHMPSDLALQAWHLGVR